jgi:aspartate beta-hydroxylase
VSFARNRALCPVTCALLEAVPRAYEHAFFSALSPGTHIIKHNGPTNKKLRIHLPLAGVRGSRLRVGGDVHEAVRGRALVFDDSFEHEAWHDGPETRLVLVFDIWHPDFSDDEVRFLNFLQKNKMRAEMAADEAQPHEESFYKLLADANQLLDGTDWWVQAADGAGDVAGDAVGGAGGAVGGAAGGAVGGGAGEGTEAAVAP